MDQMIRNIHAPDLVCICIDEYRQGEYAGRIWHQYDDEPLVFRGIIPLIRKMEELYDSWDFPQASTICRSWTGTRNAGGSIKKRDVNFPVHRYSIQENRGNLGTFIVQVKYRQNATWQGDVVWVEKGKKECFRSAMELFKMVDDAINPDPVALEELFSVKCGRREVVTEQWFEN